MAEDTNVVKGASGEAIVVEENNGALTQSEETAKEEAEKEGKTTGEETTQGAVSAEVKPQDAPESKTEDSASSDDQAALEAGDQKAAAEESLNDESKLQLGGVNPSMLLGFDFKSIVLMAGRPLFKTFVTGLFDSSKVQELKTKFHISDDAITALEAYALAEYDKFTSKL